VGGTSEAGIASQKCRRFPDSIQPALGWLCHFLGGQCNSTGAPFFFKLWGIPFVLVGLYMTIGRFFMDARKRANTAYGITSERIIIKSGIVNSEIKSLHIRTLSDITLTQKTDNTGTISLGPTDFRYAMMQGMEWPGVKQPPRLELIPDVKTVYDMIIDLQRGAQHA
jgi:hypothetical protein